MIDSGLIIRGTPHLLGSRLPGFKKWIEENYGDPNLLGDERIKKLAQDYARLTDPNGRHVDVEQHFYQDICGLEPIPPGVKAKFGPDPESLNFGFVVGKRLR